jgi:hypothetical protein
MQTPSVYGCVPRARGAAHTRSQRPRLKIAVAHTQRVSKVSQATLPQSTCATQATIRSRLLFHTMRKLRRAGMRMGRSIDKAL